MRKLVLLFMVCFLVSCETKKETKQKADEKPKTEKKSDNKDFLGRYVYEDRGHILHTKNGCKAVYRIPTVGTQPVTAIDVETIYRIDYSRICSQCVTPEQLEMLSMIAKINREEHEYTDSFAAEYDEDE